jgi:hypothetical protein
MNNTVVVFIILAILGGFSWWLSGVYLDGLLAWTELRRGPRLEHPEPEFMEPIIPWYTPIRWKRCARLKEGVLTGRFVSADEPIVPPLSEDDYEFFFKAEPYQ